MLRAVFVALRPTLLLLRSLLTGSVVASLVYKLNEWLALGWLADWITNGLCTLIVVGNAVILVDVVVAIWHARVLHRFAFGGGRLPPAVLRTRSICFIPVFILGIGLQFLGFTLLDPYSWWVALALLVGVQLAYSAASWAAWQTDPARRVWRLAVRFHSPHEATGSLERNSVDDDEMRFGELALFCCMVNRLFLIGDNQSKSEIVEFLGQEPEDLAHTLGGHNVEFTDRPGEGLMCTSAVLRFNPDLLHCWIDFKGQMFAAHGSRSWQTGIVRALAKYLILQRPRDPLFFARLGTCRAGMCECSPGEKTHDV